MPHAAEDNGQPCAGVGPWVTATAGTDPTIFVLSLTTLDQIHAVIVNDSFRALQLHYHIAEVYPEAPKNSDFKTSFAEAHDCYCAMFELLGASAARASVTLDV
ncbi:hypothetical protein ACFOKI_07130 [Sphingomonas qilianensis]|uniref:Uncharacterized protein n=1 Tax=Sphingomonas qilianensis TaxID=1736690 RepID=A0ABU9XQR3_9SPHN